MSCVMCMRLQSFSLLTFNGGGVNDGHVSE